MQIHLFITGDGVPVCGAHLEKYIDEPSFLATSCDYDAWFHSHGETMSCKRCKGVASERAGDSVDASFFEEDGAEGRRGTASGRALDDEIVRQFENYIAHASYAE